MFGHHVRGATAEGIGGIKPGQREAWLASVCFLVSEGGTLVQVHLTVGHPSVGVTRKQDPP